MALCMMRRVYLYPGPGTAEEFLDEDGMYEGGSEPAVASQFAVVADGDYSDYESLPYYMVHYKGTVGYTVNLFDEYDEEQESLIEADVSTDGTFGEERLSIAKSVLLNSASDTFADQYGDANEYDEDRYRVETTGGDLISVDYDEDEFDQSSFMACYVAYALVNVDDKYIVELGQYDAECVGTDMEDAKVIDLPALLKDQPEWMSEADFDWIDDYENVSYGISGYRDDDDDDDDDDWDDEDE